MDRQRIPDRRRVRFRWQSDGRTLSNKETAARLFISPRTAQTHLTHTYSKLNLSSWVAVVQEAARHTEAQQPDR